MGCSVVGFLPLSTFQLETFTNASTTEHFEGGTQLPEFSQLVRRLQILTFH
jgi:hypothetical protein